MTSPATDVFLFSRKSVGVSHCMCVWAALFHTLFLIVKFYILFNCLISTVLPSWWWIKMYINSYTYNGRPIESRIWSIERRYFQWPWTTPTHSFKVTPFFDAEYLRNGTTYRHSVIEILIWTYTRLTQHCHFEWHWVISSDLAKYSMTRSVARSLCDSWAFCLKTRGKKNWKYVYSVYYFIINIYSWNHNKKVITIYCVL